jgi:hypothetical protein
MDADHVEDLDARIAALEAELRQLKMQRAKERVVFVNRKGDHLITETGASVALFPTF